ncbi:hypothetical protein PCC9214_00957 [Planktothrix tepida]|uniref:Uncharacterized protein n=1 Tax=Planktothrix tepida PCC 9214 TaxID=671072 RepID=A0A1J1LI36_9CYAN|nr:hypothetical protein [Planktothrix tepida]CAD5925767.1 hypothetical protein PCC9214_00957 [Planktothrix tepida]CUR31249.1 conserved hypothetical protein [Planktothrix tepida PCC 9214]
MTQDVRQWLDEIKRLKQQLAQTQRDLNAAIESSDQWRQRYNIEAQQRRQEAQRYLEQVGELRGELERWQRLSPLPNELQVRVAVRQEMDQLKTLDEVKAKLIEAMLERDRSREQIHQLMEALEAEKAAHLETRNSLTTALGDTVDLLTKAQNQSQSATTVLPTLIANQPEYSSSIPQLPETQQPLPQLPPIEEG